MPEREHSSLQWIAGQDWAERYQEQLRRRKKRVAGRFFKRTLDIVASGFGILLLALPFLIIAAAIKRDSDGPVFFRQVRVGRDLKPFKIMKFRTMGPDSDRAGRQITVGADPRITKSGAFLRDHKIDELPQLFNVFLGQMSLVGSRPEVPAYVDAYKEPYRVLLTDRPGITDLASLTYRDESRLLGESSNPHETYLQEVLPAKLKISLTYQEEATFFSDIRLIFRTVFGS